jgi:ORF6N domain
MASKKKSAAIPVERIAQSIIILRGQRVLLDRSLAEIYGVTTGRLNEAVKRNIARFPDDFMFQLTREEVEASRSQIAILNSARGSNVKYLPFAFTEHGAIQAANVLRSTRAVEMGIYVVRAFVQLRDLLASNKELAKRVDELEKRIVRKLDTHDQAISEIIKTIRQLMNPPEQKKRPIGFVELQEKKR